MLCKLARRVLFFLVGLAVLGGILYAVGLRIALDGGGGIGFAFTASLDKRAAEIEKHREAQRAQAPAPAPVQRDPAAPAPHASPGAVPPSPAIVATSTHWTNFRGPDRDGHYRQQPVRTDWGRALTPLWKQPVGGGYASFVVAEGRAFTIEQRGRREAAAAYDLATGRELWTSAWNALFQEQGDGPRATPTWHDGRLYVLGATGEFRALDAATGRTLWRTDILADPGAGTLTSGRRRRRSWSTTPSWSCPAERTVSQ